jgi:hypothetical protein
MLVEISGPVIFAWQGPGLLSLIGPYSFSQHRETCCQPKRVTLPLPALKEGSA